MKEENQELEYHPGDKHGLVDFGSFQVVRAVHDMVPRDSFDSHRITFSRDDLHAGIIAALVSEMLPAFQDNETPSLVVSDTTIKVLEMLGISYREVTDSHQVIHKETLFIAQQEVYQERAD